jgi:hypothetical protein
MSKLGMETQSKKLKELIKRRGIVRDPIYDLKMIVQENLQCHIPYIHPFFCPFTHPPIHPSIH